MNLGLSTLELTGLVLSGEFALLAVLVPALLLRRRQQHVGVERADAARLLDSIEERTPTRREALSTIFTSTYALDGAELDAKVDEFIAREQAFYQVMTSVYLERDSSRLRELPDELTKLIAPWLRLTPRNTVAAADLAVLASTNADLAAELADTQRSMQALMDEYTAAFARERTAGAERSDAGPAHSPAAVQPAPASAAAALAAAAGAAATPVAAAQTQAAVPDEFDEIAGLLAAVTAESDLETRAVEAQLTMSVVPAAAATASGAADIIDVSVDPDEVTADAAREAAA